MKAEMPEALRSKHGKELGIRRTERFGFGSECLKPMIRRLLTEENFLFPDPVTGTAGPQGQLIRKAVKSAKVC